MTMRVTSEPAASIEELQAADSRLTRSFVACVAIVAVGLFWTLFVARPVQPGEVPLLLLLVPLLLLLLQVVFYVWYAISAGAAAKLLGAVRWHYVVWILVAPFLALVPIPIVSAIIGISPLSIKFLLGGQLQTAIRQGTFAQLHEAPTHEPGDVARAAQGKKEELEGRGRKGDTP